MNINDVAKALKKNKKMVLSIDVEKNVVITISEF